MANFEIPGDDEELRAALSEVNLPTLLMVMTQFSGDDRCDISYRIVLEVSSVDNHESDLAFKNKRACLRAATHSIDIAEHGLSSLLIKPPL